MCWDVQRLRQNIRIIPRCKVLLLERVLDVETKKVEVSVYPLKPPKAL